MHNLTQLLISVNFLNIAIVIRIGIIPRSCRCLLACLLKLLLLRLRRGQFTNALLLTFIIAVALLITVTLILNIGIHHLLEQGRLVIQLSIVRVDLVLRKPRCIHGCELDTLCVVKANVGVAQHMQVKFICALPGSQELDFVFHNLVGAGDLVNTDNLTLLCSKGNPPGLPPGEGESWCMDQASLLPIFNVVTGECDRNGAEVTFVHIVILVIIDKHFALHGHIGKDLTALENILLLLRSEILKSLLSIIFNRHVLLNCLRRGFPLGAMSSFDFGKVGKLQQLAVFDPHALCDVLTKLDTVQG
mmetsp:Transcript_4820/g.10969  ORF Transcript_4820/g.10969 Transcript_4820/m.10969 type:complete len:303 (-) Transcript_4820:1239-2147(-)